MPKAHTESVGGFAVICAGMTMYPSVPTAGRVLRIVLGMTAEERAEMNRLCERIQTEQDPHLFMELVDQLNRLLARKEKRLESDLEVRKRG